MKMLSGDNFCEVEKYKLYRNVYEIIHPTISKRNISNYKVVFDEKLLPVLVFYPKKISSINSAIIYIVGDGNVSGSYGKYADICKKVAIESNKLVIAVDYFNGNVKYPTVVNKIYKIIKYLYEEFDKNNICSEKITLMGDSTGCKLLGNVVVKMLKRNISVSKMIMLYPIVRDDYSEYKWNDACMNINFNLDKKVNKFLSKYIPKDNKVSCDLLDIAYYEEFPKTLVITGDMDIFRDDGCLLAEKLIKNVEGSVYSNIKFAAHGFMGLNDEEICREAYGEISDFLM